MQNIDIAAKYIRPQKLRWISSTSSLALSVAMLAAPVPFLAITNRALAANECGVGSNVTCDNSGTPSTNANPYAAGITYDNAVFPSPTTPQIVTFGGGVAVDTPAATPANGLSVQNWGGAVTIDTRAGSITTRGDFAYGITASTAANPGNLTIQTGNIETFGYFAAGVFAENSGSLGATTVDTTGGAIIVHGDYSRGVNAQSYGAGLLSVTTGSITTFGSGSIGILTYNDGSADTVIDTRGGTITTKGDSSHGILAEPLGSTPGTATIRTAGIDTSGVSAHGVFALTRVPISLIDTTAGLVHTRGDSASGIQVYPFAFAVPVTITAGNILTEGQNASGIVVTQASSVNITTTAGTVRTLGAGSAGIFSTSSDPAHVANITTGAISTQGVGAYGVAAAALSQNLDSPAGSITITNQSEIRSSGAEGGGIVALSYAPVNSTGNYGPSGAVTVNANANVFAMGQNAPGIAAASSTGQVVVNVASGVSVQGGWSVNPTDLSTAFSNGSNFGAIGSHLPAAGVVVYSGATSPTPAMLITNKGFIGALNDQAITMGYTCAGENGPSLATRAFSPCAGGMPPIQQLQVDNINTVTGYVNFLTGAPHVFNNSGTFEVRNFADTNGDQLRDTKAVSISNFGGPNATFNNLASGTVKFLHVTGAPTTNAAGYYVPTSGVTGLPLESSFYDLNRDGLAQGQFVNLQTFNNSGIIDLRGPAVGNTLVMTSNPTVGGAPGTGTFVANGGRLLVNTVLNDGIPLGGQGNSYSDMLIVDRTQVASPPTTIVVTNVGGAGALTPGNGIEIVEVRDKANSTPGVFALQGQYVTTTGQQAIVAGAYGYALYHNGVGADAADGNWYLRSQLAPVTPPPVTPPGEPPVTPPQPPQPPIPIYNPGVPLYETYPQVLLSLNGVPTMQQRIGNRYWNEAAPSRPTETVFCKDASKNFRCAVSDAQAKYYADYAGSTGGFKTTLDGSVTWAAIDGTINKYTPAFSTSGSSYTGNTWQLRAGIDAQLMETQRGNLFGGLNVFFGRATAKVNSIHGLGSIAANGYGIGGTLTWMDRSGFYVDGQAKVTWYRSDLSSQTAQRQMAGNNMGFGYALSLETGKKIQLNAAWSITPQAQLIYSAVSFRSFIDPFGARVSLKDGDSLRGRLGLSLDRGESWKDESGKIRRAHVYGIANLYYEFLNGTQVDVAGVGFTSRGDRLWGGVGLGGTYSWDNDKYTLFGQVGANSSLQNFGKSYALNGTLGFRMKW